MLPLLSMDAAFWLTPIPSAPAMCPELVIPLPPPKEKRLTPTLPPEIVPVLVRLMAALAATPQWPVMSVPPFVIVPPE